MSKKYLFTSESVSEGHPDKLADQVSDSILDAIISKDKHARIACETMINSDMVVLGGEITTAAHVDYETIARDTIRAIGYNSKEVGFDGEHCKVLTALGQQSADIALGVNENEGLDMEQGAGDQGLMFGYACSETDVLMPFPITYAHRLVKKQATVRKSGQLSWLRPDAKSQVTLMYDDGKPAYIDTIVLSTQHDPNISHRDIEEAVIEEIIKPVIPADMLNDKTTYLVNPTGLFVIGGPVGDCGLTGRKIIVDTYGGMARHGGGAFSGKDPSKVDRSAAYAARYVAKNIVATGLVERCEVQLSYAIGIAKPTSISINSFATGKIADDKLTAVVADIFDLRPKGIIKMLDLLNPIYKATSAYGHFGRDDIDLSWERTDKKDALIDALT